MRFVRRFTIILLSTGLLVSVGTALGVDENSREKVGAYATAQGDIGLLNKQDVHSNQLVESREEHESIRRTNLIKFYRESHRQIELAAAAHNAARHKRGVGNSAVGRSDVWWLLAGCETGGKYDNPVSPNGLYFGYFQFDLGTWESVGGRGNPRDSSYEEQRRFAIILQERYGWGRWPHCSKKLGLR